MDKEWIPVVDDAIKIGASGLIGGVFAWLVAKHTSSSTMQRLHFERRSKILSEVAQQYETFFQAFVAYSSHVAGMTDAMSKPPKSPAGEIVQAEFMAKFSSQAMYLQLELAGKIQNSLTGQAQLLLLGEKKCVEKAEALHGAISVAQNSCRFDGKKYELSGLPEAAAGVRSARIAFYEEMKKAFNKT
ncbi:MAG: hypothetical protein EXS35_03150 [Pedosphaera sp.]|nr:hypothetical protein [Pedosphaera sp.]